MTAEVEKLQRCVSNALARFAHEPGPLLEILHAVQDELGSVVLGDVRSGEHYWIPALAHAGTTGPVQISAAL